MPRRRAGLPWDEGAVGPGDFHQNACLCKMKKVVGDGKRLLKSQARETVGYVKNKGSRTQRLDRVGKGGAVERWDPPIRQGGGARNSRKGNGEHQPRKKRIFVLG